VKPVMRNECDTSGLLESDEVMALTVAEMKIIEDRGEEMGISRLVMMENAGAKIADFIFQNRGRFNPNLKSEKTKVLFVAGIGNNGGDTFVAARHLLYWKESFDVTVLLIGDPREVRAIEAKTNYRILEKIPAGGLVLTNEDHFGDTSIKLVERSHIIVIGIFGTGFRGEPRPLQKEIIQAINNNSGAIKISVDVPSGLEADTGDFVVAAKSDYTITMHAPKLGMMKSQKAKDLCGRILVTNIGVAI